MSKPCTLPHGKVPFLSAEWSVGKIEKKFVSFSNPGESLTEQLAFWAGTLISQIMLISDSELVNVPVFCLVIPPQGETFIVVNDVPVLLMGKTTKASLIN